MGSVESLYFNIDSDKMAQVAKQVQASHPEATTDAIESFVLSDWPEGQEHQDWLDAATVAEIANWVIDGLRNLSTEELNEV